MAWIIVGAAAGELSRLLVFQTPMHSRTIERIKIIGEFEGLRARIGVLTAWAERAPGLNRKKQIQIAEDLASAEAELLSVWLALGGTNDAPGYVEAAPGYVRRA